MVTTHLSNVLFLPFLDLSSASRTTVSYSISASSFAYINPSTSPTHLPRFLILFFTEPCCAVNSPPQCVLHRCRHLMALYFCFDHRSLPLQINHRCSVHPSSSQVERIRRKMSTRYKLVSFHGMQVYNTGIVDDSGDDNGKVNRSKMLPQGSTTYNVYNI